MWYPIYWKRHLGRPNMFLDRGLKDVMSREEIAEFSRFRYDLYKVVHPFLATLCTGGWGLLFWPLWLANDTWMPSSVSCGDPGILRKWRHAQDMYRYRFVPSMITDYRWFYEWHLQVPQHLSRAWENLLEKNDVRKDPKLCAQIAAMYESVLSFHRFRRKQGRCIVRAMGIASFPLFSKICPQTRIRDYWEIIFNEDHMVMQPGVLESMNDDELFDYAWRRFLAPVDKNLQREQLLQRVGDYHIYLGGEEFLKTGYHPNLFTTIVYCMGYYNEPAFLDRDFSELDENDYDHLKWWGRDLFLRRLEFENGPLRDQVEAHSVRVIEERKRKLLA